MPTYEHNVLQQHKDQNGDMHIDYPITKPENVVGLYESPALTGVPTAPTAEKGTNTEQIATTEFVQNAIGGLGGSSGGGSTSSNVNSTTIFDDDGSSTTTYDDGRSETTVFNDDGSVVTTYSLDGTIQQTKTTVFNDDGSVITTYT